MINCRLIVHADDFGLSEKVNEGIVDAHRNGIVTSTSLMATGPAFDSAIELARSIPTLDIGIHLTLIEEKPLLRKKEIPSLLSENGCFYGHATSFIKPYLFREVSLLEVEKELDAQIQRILRHGLPVSHLDSHQHIHMLPGIHRIVRKLARKYSIPAIRYPKESIKRYMFKVPGNFSRIMQLFSLIMFCNISRTHGTLHPDKFFGFFSGGNLTKEDLVRILENLEDHSTSEVMCHPGMLDRDNRLGHWNYHWQNELDALTDNDIKNLLSKNNIQLISYADLTV